MTIDKGFAIRRNGTCLAGIEVNCGKTANGMVGCCPSGFECPHAYNLDCCPSGQGGKCTPELEKSPSCANSTWDLYDNGGYFCCEHGSPGYNYSNTNICAEPGSSNNGNLLKLITAGGTATSSSSAPSSSSTIPSSSAISSSSSAVITSASIASASATTTPPQSPHESSTPVGAIAGGVVGGVAGLAILALVAWLFMRRRRQNKPENPYSAVHRSDEHGSQDMPMVHQLDETQRVYEAGAGKATYAYAKEMPAQSAPVELSAENQPPR